MKKILIYTACLLLFYSCKKEENLHWYSLMVKDYVTGQAIPNCKIYHTPLYEPWTYMGETDSKGSFMYKLGYSLSYQLDHKDYFIYSTYALNAISQESEYEDIYFLFAMDTIYIELEITNPGHVGADSLMDLRSQTVLKNGTKADIPDRSFQGVLVRKRNSVIARVVSRGLINEFVFRDLNTNQVIQTSTCLASPTKLDTLKVKI